jgi:hypothetical protein
VDFDQLPPASVIPDDHNQPNKPLHINQPPHTTPTPLPIPSLADTVRDRDTILIDCNQQVTRSSTNSLPPVQRHYNDIKTINAFVSLNEINTFLTTLPPLDPTYDLES